MTSDDQLDEITAERLLTGAADHPRQLVALLSAAAAPATQAELLGETRALHDFRTPVVEPSSARLGKVGAANAFAAKAIAGMVAMFALTGGVALAGATSNLPAPLQRAAHSAFNAPLPHHHGAPNSRRHESHPTSAPSGSRPTGASDIKASPSPNLAGLCHAFQAGATSNPGNAIRNPAFQALVHAAGGDVNLRQYCTTLIGSDAPGHSSEPGHSSKVGRGEMTSHSTGKPTSGSTRSRPDSRPSAHPSESHLSGDRSNTGTSAPGPSPETSPRGHGYGR
jgi:hypothetical protein